MQFLGTDLFKSKNIASNLKRISPPTPFSPPTLTPKKEKKRNKIKKDFKFRDFSKQSQ